MQIFLNDKNKNYKIKKNQEKKNERGIKNNKKTYLLENE